MKCCARVEASSRRLPDWQIGKLSSCTTLACGEKVTGKLYKQFKKKNQIIQAKLSVQESPSQEEVSDDGQDRTQQPLQMLRSSSS